MRIMDRAANGLLAVLGVGLIAMIALSGYNVVSRYVFNNAILWADEVAVFAMIALAWLGAVVCAWRAVEIRMDVIVASLPKGSRHVVSLLEHATIVVTCGWGAWLSYDYVSRLYGMGMRSDGAGLPLWVVHAPLTFALVAIALIACLRLWQTVTQGIEDLEGTAETKGFEI
jgi:TRAP-type C4-dicarboxylate transport system permease small subunit